MEVPDGWNSASRPAPHARPTPSPDTAAEACGPAAGRLADSLDPALPITDKLPESVYGAGVNTPDPQVLRMKAIRFIEQP